MLNKTILTWLISLLFVFLVGCDKSSDEPGPTVISSPILVSTPGNNAVTLSWEPIDGVDSYTLYWSNSTGITTTANTIADVSSPYVHAPLVNGETYFYVITATIGDVESDLSEEINATPFDTAVPPAVPIINAAVAGDKEVTLSWDTVSGADSYTLYWSNNANVTPSIGTAISNVNSPYVHSSLTNNQTYYYIVTATVGGIEGNPSNELNATPIDPLVTPVSPTIIGTVSGDKMTTISWDMVSGVDSYALIWSQTRGVTNSTGTFISNISSPFTHSALTNDVTYYYVLIAISGGIASAPSAEFNATPNAAPTIPQVPTIKNSIAGDKVVNLSWNPISGADAYTLYWGNATGVTPASGEKINNVSSPFNHSMLTNGTAYYYVLTASNSLGESLPSAEVMARPVVVGSSSIVLDVEPLSKIATLRWTDNGASNYNLFYSTDKNFDPDNFSVYPGGTLLNNVSSPHVVSGLSNGTAYYFVLEEVGTEILRTNVVGTRPEALSFNNSVRGIDAAVDGTVYMSGAFTRVGVSTGGGLALNTVTGRPTTADFPLVDGAVRACIADGQGGWYIGGDFVKVGSIERTRLAHILADGTVDLNWNPAANLRVESLAIDGSTIYVGGRFTTINGEPRERLAAIGTDGILGNWNPGASGSVNSIVVANGIVYVGGSFSRIGEVVGGVNRSHLAAISTDGVVQKWDPNVRGSLVYAMAISGTTIYVGGDFNYVGKAITARDNLFAIGTDGTLIDGFKPSISGQVAAIAIDGNTIYVGGAFTSIDTVTRKSLAAFNPDGSLTSWDPGADYVVNSLAVANGTVFAGGRFNREFIGGIIAGGPRDYVAAIGTNGVLQSFSPNPNGEVFTVAANGESVFVGGDFNSIGGKSRNYLAAINSNEELTNWSPSASAPVATLDVDGTNIYIGGLFLKINDIQRHQLAVIGTDGSLGAWDPDAGPQGSIYTLVVDNGTVYVGGWIISIGGTPRTNLAAIGTDGTLRNWDPKTSGNGYVEAIAVVNNTVYVGGHFTSIAGSPRQYAAAIGVDGVLTDWDPNPNNAVYAMAVDTNTVYLGGAFTYVGRDVTLSMRNKLAAIGVDGSVQSWNPNSLGHVYVMTIDSGNVYLGGTFTKIGGVSRNHLAAIGTDGVLSDWTSSPTTDSALYTYIIIQKIMVSGTSVYMGGNFTHVNGTPRGHFAIIGVDGQLH